MEEKLGKKGGARTGTGPKKKDGPYRDQQVCIYITAEQVELLGGKPALQKRCYKYAVQMAAREKAKRERDKNSLKPNDQNF